MLGIGNTATVSGRRFLRTARFDLTMLALIAIGALPCTSGAAPGNQAGKPTKARLGRPNPTGLVIHQLER